MSWFLQEKNYDIYIKINHLCESLLILAQKLL